jgi:hypothetical protein
LSVDEQPAPISEPPVSAFTGRFAKHRILGRALIAQAALLLFTLTSLLGFGALLGLSALLWMTTALVMSGHHHGVDRSRQRFWQGVALGCLALGVLCLLL